MNAPSSPQSPLWHTLSPDQVLRELDTAPGGLSEEEAAQRLDIHGPNRLRLPRQPLESRQPSKSGLAFCGSTPMAVASRVKPTMSEIQSVSGG